jgi:hypothetical protein
MTLGARLCEPQQRPNLKGLSLVRRTSSCVGMRLRVTDPRSGIWVEVVPGPVAATLNMLVASSQTLGLMVCAVMTGAGM